MTYELEIDWLGRPLNANRARNLHHFAKAKASSEWRAAGIMAARMAKIPPLGAASFTVQSRYTHNRLTDTDACAPALKAVLDGLVDAGVLETDTALHVKSVTYLAPFHDPAKKDALLVVVTKA